MSKSSGLRNRRRDGRSPYSIKGKHFNRDTYGQWENGRQTRDDLIAGRYINHAKARGDR